MKEDENIYTYFERLDEEKDYYRMRLHFNLNERLRCLLRNHISLTKIIFREWNFEKDKINLFQPNPQPSDYIFDFWWKIAVKYSSPEKQRLFHDWENAKTSIEKVLIEEQIEEYNGNLG
tara:strand:+ start:97 stop:453 length:357 start_codon:yes stop_codon:yes gene_type:complete